VAVEEDKFVVTRTLAAIAESAHQITTTKKDDLDPGDCVIVSTKNSVYYLQSLGGDLFAVSGGWFSKKACPQPVVVNGCTYGGSVIHTDIVAARGLFLEFGNSVSTTRIRDVRVLRNDEIIATTSTSDLPN